MTQNHRRSSGLLALAAAAVLATGGCTVTVQVGEPDTGAQASAEDETRALPVLVAGTVTRDGEPVADVPVQVHMTPTGNHKVGETIRVKGLRPVRTDAEGRYSVTLERDALPDRFFLSRNVLNFQMHVLEPFVLPVFLPAQYYPRSGTWGAVQRPDAGRPPRVDFDLGAMTVQARPGDGSSERYSLEEVDPQPRG